MSDTGQSKLFSGRTIEVATQPGDPCILVIFGASGDLTRVTNNPIGTPNAAATPVPDIVALAATLGNDLVVTVSGPTGTGAFSVATTNVGASGRITVSADTGKATLPLTAALCETNPATEACLAPPVASVTRVMNQNETPTFGVFVSASGPVPFDPAANRIVVRFREDVMSGPVTRGSTSVAVQTQ